MLKILLNSFSFKRIFLVRTHKTRYFIAYFIVLIFITSFPMNLQLVRNDGWGKLNSMTTAIKDASPDWFPYGLPSEGDITKNGLSIPSGKCYYYDTTVKDEVFIVVLNPVDENTIDYSKTSEVYYTKDSILNVSETGEVSTTEYGRAIIFGKDSIYYHEKGIKPLVSDYSKVHNPIYFMDFKVGAVSNSEALDLFFGVVDVAFSKYLVFSNIIVNTLTQILLNIILILIISSIFLAIRVKYKKITTFEENTHIVITSMTIPSLLSFIVGIIGIIDLNSFSVVLFQLLTPLIALGAIYKGSGIKSVSTKGL